MALISASIALCQTPAESERNENSCIFWQIE